MVEIIVCDTDGTELRHFGRRFNDNAPPELLVDDVPCEFVGFKESGVALYRRPRVEPKAERSNR